FFQAEDGIRDYKVTGVQTCALPILRRIDGWRMEGPVIKVNCALSRLPRFTATSGDDQPHRAMVTIARSIDDTQAAYEESRRGVRSEERRVGKEGRGRWGWEHGGERK